MRRWLIAGLPLLALVLLAALFGFYALKQKTTRVEPDFTVGKPAPEIMLSYLEGGPPVSVLAEIKGPALVNLFGSWCIPCAAEAPQLMELQKQGIRIVGLDEGENGRADPPAEVANFLSRLGDPYAVVFSDPLSRGLIDYGATGVPETFVVDSKGIIIGKQTGPIETAQQAQRLADMVKAAK